MFVLLEVNSCVDSIDNVKCSRVVEAGLCERYAEYCTKTCYNHGLIEKLECSSEIYS